MNIETLNKNKCTGCTACKNICPKKAIVMVENEEGFLFPKIDKKKCINCGLCYKICPSLNNRALKTVKNSFMAKNKECSNISTSGGIFPLIAKIVLSKNGYVCGAVVDDNNRVKHVVTNCIDVTNKMRGSKYTQSDLSDCFYEIKKILDNEIWCLFVGTPCQVSGLKAFLKKEYEKLLCVDLICHGVPSQKFLMADINNYYGDYALVGFREKNVFEGSTYKLILKSEKNTIKKYYYEDPYYNSFMEGISLRESCYSCSYAKTSRIGDITIGDSACYRKNRKFLYEDAVSLILINNKKGKKIWDDIKSNVIYKEADYKVETMNNQQLQSPPARIKKRDEVYVDLLKLSAEQFRIKYTKKRGRKKTLLNKIKKAIPFKLKRFIKRG